MTPEDDIKLSADGSIDIDFYAAKARAYRSAQAYKIADETRGFWARLFAPQTQCLPKRSAQRIKVTP